MKHKLVKKAFTLVEMMIVVAIIAVLAGVAVPQYNKYVKKSETTESLRFMKQIIDAEVLYRSHKSNYIVVNTTDSSTGDEKIGFVAPTEGKFVNYKVELCTGAVEGVLVTAATDTTFTAPNSVYMYYPSNMTLNAASDTAYYQGTTFIQDYVNGVSTASSYVPACP
jgi:prepilin-type N-terminal cleavage/methylation domain-containing protein